MNRAGGQPGSGDPEDADLYVSGAGDAIGKNVRDLDPVEPIAFHAVVRCNHTHQNLNQD